MDAPGTATDVGAEDLHFAVAADGTRIAYRLYGAGSPLLLLPGQGNDHSWWRRTAPGLVRRHTLVLLDPRGTGQSDRPVAPEAYSTRIMADDALSVLDAAAEDLGGARRAHVYGTSMGGRVAQWLAADHPDRVAALVLGCTSPGGRHGLERDDEVRRSLAVRDEDLRTERLLDLMYTPEWRARNPGPYTVLGTPTMTFRERRNHLQASDTHDAWDALPRIEAPTLVLHGSDDQMTPPGNVELLVQRIPDARGRVFAGARHAYFDERAEDATAAVLRHLETHDHLAGGADGARG